MWESERLGDLLAVLDIGTGSARFVAVDEAGKFVHFSSFRMRYSASDGLAGVGFELDAEWLWKNVARMVRDSGVADRVIGVGVTSQRYAAVFTDDEGRPLYAGPNLDARGVFVQHVLMERLGRDFHRITGHWPPLIFMPSRILWFKREKPDVYAKFGRFLNLCDWVTFKFCGEYATDYSNASETIMFDVSRLEWSGRMLEELGVTVDQLPRVVEAGTAVGEVTREACNETGIPEGTTVVACGGDTQCAVLAARGVSEGDTCAVAGTTTPIQIVLSKPVVDPDRRIWTSCHVLPGRWVLESNAGITGRLVEWFKDGVAKGEAEDAEKRGLNPYDELFRMAEEAPLGAGGILASMGPQIMDYREGIRIFPSTLAFPPLIMVDKPTTKGELFRALLENVAFAVRANCEQLREVSGVEIRELKVTGGLARSSFFLRLISDVTGLPVRSPLEKQGSSLGCAICIAKGVGLYSSFEDAIRGMVREGESVSPSPEKHKEYEAVYSRWRQFYDKVAGLGV
ncbi:MAG: FGGY family carbohydrate kinase [Candidatus Jordarchaeales archaeon]